MITAFITFAVLFGLIRLIERDRDDLDSFSIAMVAVVPVLIVILARIALGAVYPEPTAIATIPPLIMIATTFALLWKNLGIPVRRSVGYTVAVVLVNLGLELLAGTQA